MRRRNKIRTKDRRTKVRRLIKGLVSNGCLWAERRRRGNLDEISQGWCPNP